jgi:hypothetical protein
MVRQLPCTNPDTVCYLADLPRRNHVNNVLSGPPTPPSAPMAVASAPLPYDNFSSARLLKFCQYAIPIFLTLCHDPNGSAMLRPVNSMPIILVRFPFSTLLNLLAPAAATNYQWHKERIASVGMYGQRLECIDRGY